MKKVILPLVFVIIGGGLIAFFGSGKPAPELLPAPEIKPVTVRTITVTPAPQLAPVLSQGIVRPRREIDLVNEVSGRVISVAENYAQGGAFDKGDVLLRIDPADYELAVVRAQSKLAQAQELLAMEKGRALQAKREWRDLGDPAANELFLRKPQLASAEAQLKTAEAELAAARRDLNKTSIRAPFNGRVRTVNADLGQYLNAGTPLAKFYGSDVVEIPLSLTDRQLESLDWGGGNSAIEAEISADVGGQTWRWPAHISRIDSVVDNRTRLSFAIAEVREPLNISGGRPPLRVGQFVEARLTGKQMPYVGRVPADTIRRNNTVWLLDAGKLHIVDVRVLEQGDDYALIAFDQAGTKEIISSLPGSVRDGMAVVAESGT